MDVVQALPGWILEDSPAFGLMVIPGWIVIKSAEATRFKIATLRRFAGASEVRMPMLR
jgi:hypothetical protein